MDASLPGLAERVPPAALLGYLNFSDGRPEPKFQRALDDAFAFLLARHDERPWAVLGQWLCDQADVLHAAGSPAFRDVTQCRAVADFAFRVTLTAYREHHHDLLAHQSDAGLFNSFFLARVCEAVLAQGGPWDEHDRIVTGAVQRLNDYVGHRPVAVLETRPQTELYPHERLRPVPLFLRGVGPAAGPYKDVIARAVRILETTPEDIKDDAWFDLALMDELAFDPRAYDHGHPVNRRPNYLFGEWDPHLIDNKGHYRRFVVRQAVLNALIARIANPTPAHRDLLDPHGALLFEAAAVLAGTILMASGVCGDGPMAHDSDARLATLVPEVARYRDAFYGRLLETVGGDHGDLLRAEAKRLKQPFGGIRQHLNQELAKQRAAQLQNHELAVLLAELGFPGASRHYAGRIPTTSARILSEVAIRQTSAELGAAAGRLAEAAGLLPEVEDLITRGIECGALADPWNILGYQGLYPLFQSREDSTHDHRNEELIDALTRQFDLYARLLASAAAAGENRLRESLTKGVRKLAAWWDKFAAYEVSDVPRLHGGERADAALHVARALADWNKRARIGEGSAKEDIAFWRDRREGFTSPAAFAQVIEALLVQQDWRASMALLIAWLSEAANVPLEDGTASFHDLSARWLEGALTSADRDSLVPRFFALLPANAEDLWHVPVVPGRTSRSGDNVFESAYEGVTFKDSADDGQEGALAGGGSAPRENFTLEESARDLEQRLAFLAAVAELWRTAAKPVSAVDRPAGKGLAGDSPAAWLETARQWHQDLEEFVESLHEVEVPDPVGGVDEVMEYDRRRMTKDHLTDTALDTCVEVGRAIRALAAVAGGSNSGAGDGAPWESAAGRVERAVAAGGSDEVRAGLPPLVRALAREPLLFVPLSEGGRPRPILRARSTLALLESLLERLPPLGLIRETYHLVRLAKSLEKNGPESGRRVSEFDRLFRIALRSVVDTLLDAARQWDREQSAATEPLVEILRKIADSFLTIWVQHSQTLRLSAIEAVMDDSEWAPFRAFIRKYGRELFTAHFLTYGNVRGLLHRGVAAWLDGLIEQPEPDHKPEKLLGDIERGRLARTSAVQYLEVVLHTIAEHYEEYRDYNTTTTWSDYGENLYVLLDFLRLKAKYERYAWRMRPLVLAHEALCRKGLPDVAERWEKSIADFSRPLAAELMEKLAEKEAEHAVRLRTVRDRIEERFLRPLALDRLCALVEPAAAEARAGDGEQGEAFRRLVEQLRPLADNPIGVGLDVPQWLRKLRDEVDRVRDVATVPPRPADPVRLTFTELQRQLDDWEEPLTEPV